MAAIPLRVLIVEDNPNDAELVLRELRRAGYNPQWNRVQTKAGFLAELDPHLDLILSDYDMPEFSGPEALKLLQERNLCIPFIIISGTIGEDVAVEVMKLGATDYLLKDRLLRLGLAAGHAIDQGRSRRERERIEEELRSTHLQLQRLLDHSPAVIYSLKVEGPRITPQLVSENITRLLGFSVEEVSAPEWWAEHLHPEDEEQAVASVSETLERGSFTCEFRIRHKVGSYIWVEDHKRLVLDSDNKPVEIAGIWMDISERKRSEAALQRQQTELQVLFDLMPALIWFKDTNNNFLRANQRVAEATGRTLEEIEGKSAQEIYPREAAAYYADDLEVIQSGKPKLGIVEQLQSPDEQELWIHTDKVPYCDKDGNVIGVVVMSQDVTASRRAATALMESERFLQATLDALSSHIAILNENGTIIAVNAAWNRFASDTGFAGNDRGVGDDYLRVCESASGGFAEEAKAVAYGIRTVMAGESAEFHLEYPCHGPKEQRWFVVRATRFEGQDPVRVVVAHDNITKRKQAEEAMRESEERFSSAFEFAPIGVALASPDGRWLKVNRALCHLVGYSESELLSRTFQDITFSEDLPEDLDQARRVLAGEIRSYQLEKRYIHASGNLIAVSLNVSLIRDAAGHPRYFIALIQDITDRKQAEMEVRFNEQRFRLLVEATTAICWDTPASGEFEVEQPGWTAFTGQTFEELRGNGWLQAIHLDDQAETVRLWSAALANRSIYKVEHRLKRWDQTYRDMTARAVPILAEDNTIRQWIGIHSDITERKQLEKQFLRAQRMESIGTLAGGIAHDLNNVLAPIMMSIDLLKLQEKDPMRLSILSTITGSAKRGADMVRQVLSFARGVEGQQVEVHIGQLLQEIEKIANDTFLKNIQVCCNAPANLWTVLGDPTQLHQVLLNLCVNARDAMPQGGILTLTGRNVQLDEQYASMNPEVKPGPYMLIQVEDTGSGMSPEVIERIFEPFFTTKELGKGTGLGLSTTIAIVKSHGGFVQVHSEVGVGTQFRIYLPSVMTCPSPLSTASEDDLPRGDGELVLVVDDEAAVRQITKQTLEAFGYSVLLASDGADATAIYATQRASIAAVLTDMMMPTMDGPTTIQVLLRMNPQVKIIAASGLNTDNMVAKAANAGVTHFIAKPYTAEILLKTLRSVLHG